MISSSYEWMVSTYFKELVFWIVIFQNAIPANHRSTWSFHEILSQENKIFLTENEYIIPYECLTFNFYQKYFLW